MNRLELIRYEHGATRVQVATATGIPIRTLRSLEDGSTVKPSAPSAKALADFYGITVAELLGISTDDDREAA